MRSEINAKASAVAKRAPQHRSDELDQAALQGHEIRVPRGGHDHRAREHAPALKAFRAGFRIDDVRLQAAHHVIAIGFAAQVAPAIDEGRIEQLAQGGKRAVVAIVRRRSRQDQAVGDAGQDFGQAAALGVFTVLPGAEVHDVVGLVEHNHVEAGALQKFEHTLLLKEIDGCQGQGRVIERVGAQLVLPTDLLHAGAGEDIQAQAEALTHFRLPLVQQRPSWRDEQHAVGELVRHQFHDDDAGLDGLAEPDGVGQQEPDAAHANRPEDRHKLVRLDAEAARLDGQESVRPESLLQQERLVIHQPVADWPGPLRGQFPQRGLDGFERVKEFDLAVAERAVQTAQSVQCLHAERLCEHHFPAQPAGLHLRSWQ